MWCSNNDCVQLFKSNTLLLEVNFNYSYLLITNNLFFRTCQFHQWMEAAHLPWAVTALQWMGWDRVDQWAHITWTGITPCTGVILTVVGHPHPAWCPTEWAVTTPWVPLMVWWDEVASACRHIQWPRAQAVVAVTAQVQWRLIACLEVTWRQHQQRQVLQAHLLHLCLPCRLLRARYPLWYRERQTNGQTMCVKCLKWFVKKLEKQYFVARRSNCLKKLSEEK